MVARSFLQAIPLDRTVDRTTARSCDACHSRPSKPERRGNTVVRFARGSPRPRTSAECLNIINVVEAGRIYAQKLSLAQEAQDTCRRIVVMAERKIGQELIEAQKRGELAAHGGDRKSIKISAAEVDQPATYEDFGITYQQAHEFKQMASLSDQDIEETMAEACGPGVNGLLAPRSGQVPGGSPRHSAVEGLHATKAFRDAAGDQQPPCAAGWVSNGEEPARFSAGSP